MTTKQETAHGAAWGSMRVMLAPGGMLVARQGQGVVVADPQGAAQDATTDRLLELLADTDPATPARSGADLVRAAAALLVTAAPSDVPPLALVTADEGDLLVTLTRGMRVAFTDESGGSQVVGADDSLLPVSRVLGSGVVAVALGTDPDQLEVDRRSNLANGVVRAGGLILEPAPQVVEASSPPETLVDLVPPPPVDPEPPAPSFTTFPLHDDEPSPVAEDAPSRDSAPEPGASTDGDLPAQAPVEQVELIDDTRNRPDVATGSPETEEPGDPGGEVMVRGIVCSRGHFNPPDARFCERCGISTVHQTHNVVTGVRPPLGVLVLDDGAVHPLARDLVVGRAPEEAEEVRSGRAAALVLDDPELSLSRTHARLVLDGWEVRIEDAGSVNGTFVAEPGTDEWVQLEAGRPTTITAGTRLRMGSRVLSFESHHRV